MLTKTDKKNFWKNYNYETMLHLACKANMEEFAVSLISKMNINAIAQPDGEGLTALDIATKNGLILVINAINERVPSSYVYQPDNELIKLVERKKVECEEDSSEDSNNDSEEDSNKDSEDSN